MPPLSQLGGAWTGVAPMVYMYMGVTKRTSTPLKHYIFFYLFVISITGLLAPIKVIKCVCKDAITCFRNHIHVPITNMLFRNHIL